MENIIQKNSAKEIAGRCSVRKNMRGIVRGKSSIYGEAKNLFDTIILNETLDERIEEWGCRHLEVCAIHKYIAMLRIPSEYCHFIGPCVSGLIIEVRRYIRRFGDNFFDYSKEAFFSARGRVESTESSAVKKK